MKAVLVFVDGLICDTRQRQHLSGTPDYLKREAIMKDAPTPDSLRCLQELAARYDLVYLAARPEEARQGDRGLADRHELSARAALSGDDTRRSVGAGPHAARSI